MANYLVDERDQRFVLFEQLGLDDLVKLPRFADFSHEIFEMTLAEAKKFAVEVLEPTVEAGEKEGCKLENGQVRVPPSYHEAYRLFKEGGWISMSQPVAIGGQGMPYTLYVATREYFNCNCAFHAYPGLAEGVAHLVATFGTEEQKATYIDKLLAGRWGGTMVLTEPNAGSDVGALTTTAKKNPDGSYSITGTKIFITGGDQDLTENIIHPVLARVEGAPAGTKGISLFLVPKYLVNDDGSLGPRNDYTIGGLEKKMGFKGSSTCLMNFGDNGKCRGELLGEENQGMRIMFVMMNEARVAVGIMGLAAASRSYLYSVKYARERLQGASLANFRDPTAPKVAIINHPDVRRMLLWMKATVEGLRALIYYSAYCVDRSRAAETEEEREKWHGFAELLTPVVKSYGSDMGFLVANQGVQVYGGYGYTADYPMEQILRDVRIAPLFEGTNGIQALDLVARKLGQKKGKPFTDFIDEMRRVIAENVCDDKLADLVGRIKSAVGLLSETSGFFAKCSVEGKFLIPIGNAYPFLNLMAIVILSWMLVWQAAIAQKRLDALATEKGVDPSDWEGWARFIAENLDASFYAGKITTAKFYVNHILPEAEAIARAIRSEDMSIMEMAESSFAS
jgi:alkylation response protein AidB-like acyl-CoA dehydrogenase